MQGKQIIRNQLYQVLALNLIVYSTLILHLLSISTHPLLLWEIVYCILALIIFVLSLINKVRKIEKENDAWSLYVPLKTFLLHTLLILPLVHFILFESYLMGIASDYDLALFYASGLLAVKVAPLGGLLFLLFDLIHSLIQKLISFWTSRIRK